MHRHIGWFIASGATTKAVTQSERELERWRCAMVRRVRNLNSIYQQFLQRATLADKAICSRDGNEVASGCPTRFTLGIHSLPSLKYSF